MVYIAHKKVYFAHKVVYIAHKGVYFSHKKVYFAHKVVYIAQKWSISLAKWYISLKKWSFKSTFKFSRIFLQILMYLYMVIQPTVRYEMMAIINTKVFFYLEKIQ